MFYNGLKCGGGSVDLPSLTQGTATASDIVNGKTAWVNGILLTGLLSALTAKADINIFQVTPVSGKNTSNLGIVSSNKAYSASSGLYWNTFQYKLGNYNDEILLPFTKSYGWDGNVAIDINYYAINTPINISDYVEISAETQLYIQYKLEKDSSGNVKFSLMYYTFNNSISAFKPMNIKIY